MDRRAVLGTGAMMTMAAATTGLPAFGQTASAPAYKEPYIDTDEWRDAPARHRYVHGGFKGTDLLFSLYFPPKELYQGRFFQPLAATSGNENSAPMAMFQASGPGFAMDSGGYLVESNQGAKNMYGGSYQANAAVAEYARTLARAMYGGGRPYGYVYGGSGGAFKTIGCMENTDGVWDGFLPFVHGSPVAIPSTFTVQAHAFRILRDRFDQIAAALEPGGGDMYAGLSPEEREALTEITRMGFPPRAWFNHRKIAFGYTGVFTTLVEGIVQGDPSYFEDFWTKPGYLGFKPPPSLVKARIQTETRIKELITPEQARALGLPLSMAAAQIGSGVSFPAGLRLEAMPQGDLQGSSLFLSSGGAKDTMLTVAGVRDDILMIGFGASAFQHVAAIRAGDTLRVDNSIYLAAQTYHRHIDPGPEYAVWDQFRDPDGKPIYPQRADRRLVAATNQTGGASQSGVLKGKVMVMQAMMDEAAFPWMADWYRKRVAQRMGRAYEDQYRLYFVDNTMHTTQPAAWGDPRPVATTRVVSYQGVLQQGLRHLADWVEKGVKPPASSGYLFKDGQITLASTAAARRGLQPLVTARANGGAAARVKVGEPVAFMAVAESPPGAAPIVAVEWDFEGAGEYPVTETFDQAKAKITARATHAFSRPGVYFPAVRVSSHARGDATSAYARMQNIGRVRVTVV